MPDYNVTVAMGGGPVENGVYSVLSYGATGDGSTDDTTAIQACIDAVTAAGGGEVYFPPLTFRTTATLTVPNTPHTNSPIHVNAGSATIEADEGLGGPIIELGADGAQHGNVDLTGGFFKMADLDWTDTVGVRIVNMYNSHVRDVWVKYCEKGIELSAITTSDGCSYNSINARQILDCLYGFYVENDYDGWCNENYFYGESGVNYTSTVADVDCSGGAGFYAKPADHGGTSVWGMNSLTLSGISLEFGAGDAYDEDNGHTRPPAVDVDASYCTFMGVRTEGWSHGFTTLGITAANPCVVTLDVTDHGIEVGDIIYMRTPQGMDELSGNQYEVSAITADTITLDVNASGFTAYSGPGDGSDLGRAYRSEIVKFGGNSTMNQWIGGHLENDYGPQYAVPEASRLRCALLTQRNWNLPGGNNDAAVLSLRTMSGGYNALEVFRADSENPSFTIGDDANIIFAPDAVPDTPAEGMVYYDATANKLKVYTGAAWETITSA